MPVSLGPFKFRVQTGEIWSSDAFLNSPPFDRDIRITSNNSPPLSFPNNGRCIMQFSQAGGQTIDCSTGVTLNGLMTGAHYKQFTDPLYTIDFYIFEDPAAAAAIGYPAETCYVFFWNGGDPSISELDALNLLGVYESDTVTVSFT